MTMQARGSLARYGAAVAFVALATGLRLVLEPLVGDNAPYALAFAAVAAAARYGGLGPAVLATILGGGATYSQFVPAGQAFGGGGSLPGLFLFLLASGTVLGFNERLRRERRRAEDAEKRERQGRELVETTLRSIGDAVIATDSEGRVTFLNLRAETLTGWTSAEAAGQPLESVFHVLDGQTRQRLDNPAQRALREGPTVGLGGRAVLVARDGREEAIDDSAAPIAGPDGLPVGAVLVFRSVERAREAEREKERLSRRKDEFLATLAHELRNPLAPMRNALEIMRLAGPDSGAAERARALIERQLAQMVRLIDDLLDVSRISLGRLELRRARVELAALVSSAVETSRPLIESSGHQLTVSLPREPVYVDGDLTRLAQVLVNLLNNAARYMEAGGRIRLSAEKQDGRARLRVSDAGFGIPAEMLPHVFSMFTTGSRFGRPADGGLGIGLTLVKQLVDLHGGTIEAHSEGSGRGSEFVIELPAVAAPPPQPRPEPPLRDASSGPRRRILVVDDNGDAAVSLATMLRMMGHETHTAHDGPSALELAATRHPQVVLLDIGMPGMSGYEVAAHIRSSPWGREMMLIALTGWGQEEDRRRSREAGFDEHLVKPVHPELLAGVIAGLPTPAN